MTENAQLSKTFLVEGCTRFAVMFVILIVPVLIYTSRSVISKIVIYPFDMQIPFIFGGWIGAISLSIVASAIYAAGRMFGLLKPRHTKMLRMVIAVIGAIAIAQFAPITATDEQIYFDQHRDDFQHQIELIQQGKTFHQYNNLGVYTPSGSHTIVFSYFAQGFKTEYAYVYAPKYSELAGVITCSAIEGSGGVGQIYATLATNWYLCYRTGN
ncbi:MAG: hypothetical protein ABI947_30345 [Chloroflexota bacterium]